MMMVDGCGWQWIASDSIPKIPYKLYYTAFITYALTHYLSKKLGCVELVKGIRRWEF